MPRKAFVTDLQEAILDFHHERIFNLSFGSEDGSITFRYARTDATVAEATVQALVPDVGNYPTSHTYMVYTTSENVPASVNSALEAAGGFDGLRVTAMLTQIANLLDQATAGSSQRPIGTEADFMEVDGSDPEAGLDEDDSDTGFDGGWSPESTSYQLSDMKSDTDNFAARHPAVTREINRRRGVDLRQAKQAGFRVSHLGGLINNAEGCIVMLSCRVWKLGISEEAMRAWDLQPNQYFVLIIRYTDGYRNLDQLVESETSPSTKTIETRVALCSRYKLSKDEALSVFASFKTKEQQKYKSVVPHEKASSLEKGLYPLFIARPLDELMNDRLVALIKYRMTMGLGWAGAEDFYTDHQGMDSNHSDGINDKYWMEPFAPNVASLPRIIMADHLQRSIQKNLSFPLVAMQFALRHLVRCTEFCLVCHCRVETTFEALKPYVCSKPLCLYQYMALGFGPSIEHEIMSQPHVVDLLISFCYVSALSQKLKSLPDGMSLCVPLPNLAPCRQSACGRLNAPLPVPETAGKHSGEKESNYENITDAHNQSKRRAKFDQEHMEFILPPQEKKIFPGNWISFIFGHHVTYHCRVNEVLSPTVRLGPPVICAFPSDTPLHQRESRVGHGLSVRTASPSLSNAQSAPTPTTKSSASSTGTLKYPEIEFIVYDQNFDDLTWSEKQNSVGMLLETLPSVAEMKDYLQSETGKAPSLHTWSDRISPAALGVLRWIIASNRSCIVQVDSIDGGSRAPEERVSGMPDWMQFRFAQGAPDKEQRFIQSVQNVTRGSKYPTLFAWHGSPLYNWHSIVREGLHFQDTAHGRAYGHGVYHSTNVLTSLGYTGLGYTGRGPVGVYWPHSHLKITQAIALNEIVNAPKQFVSNNPHLVVAQLDWIQTRYLFVKPDEIGPKICDDGPSETYQQDPAYTPKGSWDRTIAIPITAVSKSRRTLSKSLENGKKVKISHDPSSESGAMLSDATDIEDLRVLGSDEDLDFDEDIDLKTGCRPEDPKTKFIPGSLDLDTLPLLQPPTYATPFGSKVLQRELKATLKAQESHPAHELGWYINPELVTNVYQWIVELHSFETDLPLARDMESKNLQSIVMEIRFGQDYPISPPFVRIVRPRFVSFMQGGGGHVTAGGALCMELLTNTGWSAVSNIESVLLQVRLAISSTEPRPARLESGPVRDYGVGEAVEAYIRACHRHGWEVPKDFRSNHLA
ncbi:MAG: hypothetical protein Q9167_006870 [Letrouitia subvulpina]